MAKFRLTFNNTASASTEVDAEDLEGAIEVAYENLPSGVCAQCSGWGRDFDLDLGDVWEFDESGHDVDGEYIRVTE